MNGTAQINVDAPGLRKQQRAALVVASLSSFIGPFMGSSVNVALPTIGSEFSMGAVLLGWVNTAFLLTAAAFLIPFGRLGDIYGRKRIYKWGVVVFTAASGLVSLASSSAALILFRALQGLGSAMIFATGMPILVSVFPPGSRGRALGISVAAVYLGLSLGPFAGGLITQQLGWRYVFALNLPLGAFLFLVIARVLKGEWADAAGAKFDVLGSVILAVSLPAMMYGFSSLPKAHGFVLTVVGVAGSAAFVIYESKAASPVLEVKLFARNRVFAFSNLAALISYAATFAVTFLLSLFLQRTRGFSPQHTGLVLLAQPATQTLLSPFAGRLSDKLEPRTVASAGMGLTLLGLVMLAFLQSGSSIPYLIGCLVVLGCGFALFSSPNTNAIMSSVERRQVGIAGAMVGTVRQVGMMFSMGVVMLILALLVGDSEITQAMHSSFLQCMRFTFVVFAVLSLVGVFASLARGELTAVRRTAAGGRLHTND